MTEILINKEGEGLRLSAEAVFVLSKEYGFNVGYKRIFSHKKWLEAGSPKIYWEEGSYRLSSFSSVRTDEDIIEVVRALGDRADGPTTSLKIVEIPDDVSWYIDNRDGGEIVCEEGRVWS